MKRTLNILPRLMGFALVMPGLPTAACAEVATELTQYGITWKFDRPCVVGKFVTGDYWVVGPVRIVSVKPEPMADVGFLTGCKYLLHDRDTKFCAFTARLNMEHSVGLSGLSREAGGPLPRDNPPEKAPL